MSLSWQDSQVARRESPCRDNTIEGNVGVEDESLRASRIGGDNGFAGAGGQPAPVAFPKAFSQGFYKGFYKVFLEAFARVARANDERSADGTRSTAEQRLDLPVKRLERAQPGSKARQLFRSGLIFFSNSSIEVSPLIFSPLTKKVGVESTFSTSLAYFWSAAILSSSD